MLRFKAGVRINAFYSEAAPVLRHVCDWSRSRSIDVRMTSAADTAAGRVRTSLHPDDLAWDFSVSVPDRETVLSDLANYLSRRLGDPYQVIAHGPTASDLPDHVHVEADYNQ